jgi:hypothetical protein
MNINEYKTYLQSIHDTLDDSTENKQRGVKEGHIEDMDEFKPVETKDNSTVNPTTKAGKSLRPNSSTVEKSETLKETIAFKFFQEAFGGQLDESTSNEDILEVANCLVDLCKAVCEAVALGEDGANEITHKGSCNEVHPDMSHEDWEKEQRIQGEEEPNENELEDIVNIESVEHASMEREKELGESVVKEMQMQEWAGGTPGTWGGLKKRKIRGASGRSSRTSQSTPPRKVPGYGSPGVVSPANKRPTPSMNEGQSSEIDMHLKDGKSPEQISKIMNIPIADVTSNVNSPKQDSSFRGSEDLLNTIKQIGSAHGPNRLK